MASTAVVLKFPAQAVRSKVVASCAIERRHLKAVDLEARHHLTGGRLKHGCGPFVSALSSLRTARKTVAKKNNCLRKESSPTIQNSL